MLGLLLLVNKEWSLREDFFFKFVVLFLLLPPLKKVLGSSSYFLTTKEGTLLKQKILQENDGFYDNKPVKYFIARCCDQSMFDILVCWALNSKKKVLVKKCSE